MLHVQEQLDSEMYIKAVLGLENCGKKCKGRLQFRFYHQHHLVSPTALLTDHFYTIVDGYSIVNVNYFQDLFSSEIQY